MRSKKVKILRSSEERYENLQRIVRQEVKREMKASGKEKEASNEQRATRKRQV